ncbi:MAG: CRTAC1 family protein [Planctomycetes bacterium]|nr:CRTAC1 family protein [Planctomycetota bacterium]MBL7039414.1 CRTAC1 family protein [Pirellulaceae bacterium]
MIKLLGLQRTVWLCVVAAIGIVVVGVVFTSSRNGHDESAGQPAAVDAGLEQAGNIHLTDVTKESGITFRHDDGGSGEKYLVEPVSAGLALLDFDGDGLIDIYFVNGAPLPPRKADPTITNALYLNEGDFHFRDVTREAGVGDPGHGLGVAVADYDNDGDPDIYVNNFGPNVLYRNNGDGTFDDVTDRAGVACGNRVGAGACFLDADGDGLLDLYVSNYVDIQIENHVRRMIDGYPSYPGPLSYKPVADVLYSNKGDGTFTDVSEASGVGQVAGNGMGMVCADCDNDGDTDIFVVNDGVGNYFFENDGSGRFEEVGVLLGLAYNFAGSPLANMGVDCADYDNDGWLDFYTTSYSHEWPVLYRNQEGGFFEDVTSITGAGAGLEPHVNWGPAFADFDNDGDRDLFVAVGHLDQNIRRRDSNTAFRARNVLLSNSGDGRFVNVSDRCGDGLDSVESSRGIGLDDLDNDGDSDVIILNSRAGATILRNDTENVNHWLQVELRGTQANGNGVGSQVRVTAGGRTQLDEVHSGRGYQSHHGMRLHFGLGGCDRVDRIEVRWLGGGTQVIEDIGADQLVVVVEGSDAVAASPVRGRGLHE